MHEVAGVNAQEAVVMSLAMVGVASGRASVLHGRQGQLNYQVAALCSSAGMVGAFLSPTACHKRRALQ